MPKLNQIIAVSQGKKTQVEKTLTEVHHHLQKPALLEGIARTYTPLDEDGERFPPESKRVQLTVRQAIEHITPELIDWMNLVATQEESNTQARGTVTANGTSVLSDVPVTVLLFLERRLVDLHTFVSKLPILDSAEAWTVDETSDAYVTPEHETTKTKKVPRVIIKYDATTEHPAQTEMFSEDQVVGHWTTKKFSGAIPQTQKRKMLQRVRELQEAVKFARESANSMEVVEMKIGKEVLDYIFS